MEDLFKNKLTYLYGEYQNLFNEMETPLFGENGEIVGMSYDLKGITEMRDDLYELINICDNILR